VRPAAPEHGRRREVRSLRHCHFVRCPSLAREPNVAGRVPFVAIVFRP
jgi:hypothetical protein